MSSFYTEKDIAKMVRETKTRLRTQGHKPDKGHVLRVDNDSVSVIVGYARASGGRTFDSVRL